MAAVLKLSLNASLHRAWFATVEHQQCSTGAKQLQLKKDEKKFWLVFCYHVLSGTECFPLLESLDYDYKQRKSIP